MVRSGALRYPSAPAKVVVTATEFRFAGEDDMRGQALLGVAVGFIVAAGTDGLLTKLAASSDGVLKVRVYDYARTPAGILQEAVDHSAGIFANATFVTNWHICEIRERVHLPDDPQCAGPVAHNEFSVRLVNRAARTSPNAAIDVLGYAVVSAEHTGALATVLLPRVRELAERTGLEIAPLLGRVMAHEVGHLALGSTDHAEAGLMRGVWTFQTLTLGHSRDWNFSREEAARLKTRIVRQSTN